MKWVGLFFICFSLGNQAWGKVSLNVYTSRKSQLIQPLFEAYTRKTGIAIRSVNGRAGTLIQKLKQEGKKNQGRSSDHCGCGSSLAGSRKRNSDAP